MANEIPQITAPVSLIWGLNDTITPAQVAHEFCARLPNAKLCFIDACCHAPMMEVPDKFNKLVRDFLDRN